MPAKKTTAKKTTTKKTTSRKPTTKKATTRRVVTKKPTVKKTVIKKTPAVIVKENTIQKSSCPTSICTRIRSIVTVLLLLINTVLLCIIAFRTTTNTALFSAMEDFEAMRVGGQENHQIMKEIYKLDAYKNDQKMRLETTLKALQEMNLDTPTQE